MSYTGNGASKLERPTPQKLDQEMYPHKSATRVTSAGTVSLATPQSGGWATKIRHGSYTEQPQKLPARQVDQVDACTTQKTERKTQIVHSARKRKECPTKEEKMYNR
jgi:poly(3-hydroxybutyrate) depolymerase